MPEVFKRSEILMITVSIKNWMLSRLIRDSVCTLCIDAEINKVANFRVRSFKLKGVFWF